MMRWLLRLFGPVLGAAAMLAAAPAFAQVYSATITSADLGKIVDAPSSSTTFTFAASSGSVSQSGSATRVSTGTARAEVDFGCTGSGSACNSSIDVKIQSSGAYTGKASAIGTFTVSVLSNGTIGTVTGTDPITFTITSVNKNNLPKIYVGATVTINGNSQSGTNGTSTAGFTVLAAKTGTTPATITGGSGSVTAVVDRPIAFTSTSTTLEFGTIYRPRSGTSTIKLDPNLASNPITITGTGDATALPTPTPARVAYSIQGEGGQTFSITLSALSMTSGANTLPVTLLTSTPVPTTLSNAVGSLGTATFYVGGQFDLTPSTPSGTYSGSYNVTVQYN